MNTICWIELTSSDLGVLDKEPTQLSVPQQTSVYEALLLIGHPPKAAQDLLSNRAISVFGVYALASTVLCAGDRIEILDALRFNPMESRRRRVEHRRNESSKLGRKSGMSHQQKV